MNVNASAKPSSGDVSIGISTLLTIPPRFSAPNPAPMIVAPSSPPIRAWLLELGSPRCQVMRFQAIAPIRAAATIAWVVVWSSTRPLPIVLATAVPANAPMKLNEVAMRIAQPGDSARVATEVAIELAVSWNPFV
jgi:hypothetical protein